MLSVSGVCPKRKPLAQMNFSAILQLVGRLVLAEFAPSQQRVGRLVMTTSYRTWPNSVLPSTITRKLSLETAERSLKYLENETEVNRN
jgi:hypothetical protein